MTRVEDPWYTRRKRMTQPALVLHPSPLLAAFEHELENRRRHPLCGDAAAFVPREAWEAALGAPLREFLARPGKELRGGLAQAFFALVSDGAQPPENLPLIVEALHAGSLVVDDIEDDSCERRGRPALHRQYGVPLALNAGNWLYFWAARLLADLELSDGARIAAHDLMTRSLLDSHYGQALDLSARASTLSQAELPSIVRATTELKTGSLVALSGALGALTGGAGDHVVSAVYRFGRELGAVLQMLDDLGGILSAKRLAKGEEDLRNDRPTWAWAWLATKQPAGEFRRLRSMAVEVLEGAEASSLLTQMRDRLAGERAEIGEALEAAFSRLGHALPQRKGLRALRSKLEQWQSSYF
jgi:geranylgeranyl pyrophosphate synthase